MRVPNVAHPILLFEKHNACSYDKGSEESGRKNMLKLFHVFCEKTYHYPVE